MTDRARQAPGPAKKAAGRATKSANPAAKKAAGEAAALEKIAAMPERFRAIGERLHALILRSAPALQPTVWYGMPGYAKEGKTVCFSARTRNT